MPPSPRKKLSAAVVLGKLAKGKRKTLTPAALQQRRAAGFKRLPKATVQAAQAAAKDDATFSEPAGWEDDGDE